MSVVFFVLDTVFFALVFSAVLRAWLNAYRISMAQQPGVFVLAVTDWLVLPIHRILPKTLQRSRWDVASVCAATLLALAHAGLVMGLGWTSQQQSDMLPWLWMLSMWLSLAFKFLLRSVLQGAFMLLLLHAVMSWVQPYSPVQSMLDRLLHPMLAPIRRWVPLIGGVDLSVLVLMLLLQMGLMLVG
jgi:YggT family protein